MAAPVKPSAKTTAALATAIVAAPFAAAVLYDYNAETSMDLPLAGPSIFKVDGIQPAGPASEGVIYVTTNFPDSFSAPTQELGKIKVGDCFTGSVKGFWTNMLTGSKNQWRLTTLTPVACPVAPEDPAL
jgi:hypothetical protein